MDWRKLGLFVLLAALLFTGCADARPENMVTREVVVTRLVTAVPGEIVEMCTLMGCTDSLTVNLTGNVPASFDLTVAGQEASCVAGQWINGHVGPGTTCDRLVLPLSAAEVSDAITMVAVWSRQEAVATAVPVFATVQPNGPNCEPTCLQGQVTFAFP